MVKLSDLSKDDLLNAIRKVESPKRNSQKNSIVSFVDNFFKLKKFKEVHGHCNVHHVLNGESNDGHLKRWLTRQRSKAANNQLSIVRQQILEQIGIDWRILPNVTAVESGLNKESSSKNDLHQKEPFCPSLDLLYKIFKKEMDHARNQEDSKFTSIVNSSQNEPVSGAQSDKSINDKVASRVI